MDKQAARQFRDRWRAVKQIELAERRAASTADRWKQFNAIIDTARLLGIPFTKMDRDEEAVRRRWNVLKSRLT